MTSISSTTGSLGSLTSYYKLLASAKQGDDTETSASEATAAAAAQLATGSLSMLGSTSDSGASTGSDPLSQLLGNTFTNTNSLLSQLNALVTDAPAGDGAAATDAGTGTGAAAAPTDPATKQQQIQAILAKLMATQQTDSLSLFT